MTSVVTDNNFGAHVDLSMYKLLVRHLDADQVHQVSHVVLPLVPHGWLSVWEIPRSPTVTNQLLFPGTNSQG